MKKIKLDKEGKEKLKQGMNLLADAVKSTLGPKGRTVIMSRQFLGPHVTKDGISVAQKISSEDPIEELGIQFIREVCQKTLEESGDGTTTSVVLAQAMLQPIDVNPIYIKTGIEEAIKEAVEYIKLQAKPVENNIEAIATISANNDPFIGSIIKEAVEKAGKDGLITVEESKSTDTYIELVEGLKFDKGYISPYFVTDPEQMIASYKNAVLLLTDAKITSSTQITNPLKLAYQHQRPLVIICEDLTDEALSTLVVNKMKGIPVIAIKAPSHGQTRKDMLEDFAVLTGGTALIQEKGLPLDKFQPEHFGTATVKVTKDSTTLTETKGKKEEIEARIAQIKAQAEVAENGFEQEKLIKRVSKLSNGVSVIYVGGHTEVELKEKKDRIEDAVLATKAALAEGIVPGGGYTYLKATKAIKKSKNPDINKGKELVKKALEAPITQILLNAGLDPEPIINKVKLYNKGYNALTNKYEDLLKTGVIDPAKVTRTALQNAASVATLYLTTEVIIAETFNQQNII